MAAWIAVDVLLVVVAVLHNHHQVYDFVGSKSWCCSCYFASVVVISELTPVFPVHDVNMTSLVQRPDTQNHICETTPCPNVAVVFSFVLPEARCRLVKAGISGGEGRQKPRIRNKMMPLNRYVESPGFLVMTS
jgi:hypothetical protein